MSRQQEAELHNHFGWPFYWVEPGLGIWPPYVSPRPVPVPIEPPESAKGKHTDPHLRSQRAVTGYHIHATDGALGHVEDFVADDALWVIRYMVVHTGKWLPAKKVLLAPQWLGEIRYANREVTVRCSLAWAPRAFATCSTRPRRRRRALYSLTSLPTARSERLAHKKQLPINNAAKPDAAMFDHLGDIYAALNQRDQASKAWGKSLSVASNRQVQAKLADLSAR